MSGYRPGERLKWTGNGLVFGTACGTGAERVAIFSRHETSQMVQMVVQDAYGDTFVRFRLDELGKLKTAIDAAVKQLENNKDAR